MSQYEEYTTEVRAETHQSCEGMIPVYTFLKSCAKSTVHTVRLSELMGLWKMFIYFYGGFFIFSTEG